MAKINRFDISGLRGIKNNLSQDLNEKSILLYGDNGTGKSSIADAFEWFYTDGVSHLTGEEINLKEALRNWHLSEEDLSLVRIEFNSKTINNTKSLSLKKNKWQTEFSETNTDWDNYLQQSQKENLILRYQSLRDFILQTKTGKLSKLSEIIGFSEVSSTQDVLKKAYRAVASDIRAQNFEGQISDHQQTLVDKIGALVTQEKDLFIKLNEIIKDKKTGVIIKEMSDVDKVLTFLKTSTNTQIVTELNYLEKCSATLSRLKSEIIVINDAYEKYYSEFEGLSKDVESSIKFFLTKLLQAGTDVLTKKYHKDPTCPLCLQAKNLSDLQKEVAARLREAEESNKKKASFDISKELLSKITDERILRINSILSEKLMSEYVNSEIKESLVSLFGKFQEFKSSTTQKVLAGDTLTAPKILNFNEKDFESLTHIASRIIAINKIIAENNSTQLFSNISAAKEAFQKMKKVDIEKSKYEYQKTSLGLICSEFIKKQKEGLDSFIANFSGTINEFYQFMNPGELFQEIRIVTIGEEDDLKGLTIEYKHNGGWASPPQKYFSESHINCLGISFFLASVVAFNKHNKFFILDDVISSFDSTHRKKFADLLFEKFSDWQIILLTHEMEWFQHVSQLAKRNNWQIKEVFWSEEAGTHLEASPKDIKEYIEASIASGTISYLGNPLRIYLEHVLKGICLNLDVKLSFKFNEDNEKRMPNELLSGLRSKINKYATEQSEKNIFLSALDSVLSSSILVNILSHDNPFNPKLGDLKAFWVDVSKLERLFNCNDPACSSPNVSLKNYDTVYKKIRCGCDKLKYAWKT